MVYVMKENKIKQKVCITGAGSGLGKEAALAIARRGHKVIACVLYEEQILDIQEIKEKEKGKVPSVLCVICGLTNAAYQRPDGGYVVPITALKP